MTGFVEEETRLQRRYLCGGEDRSTHALECELSCL